MSWFVYPLHQTEREGKKGKGWGKHEEKDKYKAGSCVDPRNIELEEIVIVVRSNRVAKKVIELSATIATGKVLNFFFFFFASDMIRYT